MDFPRHRVRMMLRIIVFILLLLPAVVLGGWLYSEHLSVLLEPQWWWISTNNPNGAPAACEAAASLRLYNGERPILEQPPALTAADAKTLADLYISDQYAADEGRETAVSVLEYGGPSLFRATLVGERRLVWLYTARITTSHVGTMPGTDMPGAAAVVYLDGNTGAPLALLSAVGAGSATAMCPFPLRDWAVTAVRSTPFIAFGGYVALLLALVVLLAGYQVIRNLRKKV